MASRIAKRRLERGNKMFAALESESDRGKACVGDAMLDEIIKELVARRLIKRDNDVRDLLAPGRPLGGHDVRLRLSYLLGWIGPETYRDCLRIHRIRNKMAHHMDVDSFEHPQVRDLVNELEAPRGIASPHAPEGKSLHERLKRPQDRVLIAVTSAMMRCWSSIDRGRRAREAKDAAVIRVPQRLASLMTDPRIPNVPS